jgi:hypothetical protein
MSLLRQHAAGAQAANAFEIGINGNTAASIAMMASRFSSNMCQRIDARHAFVVMIQKRLNEVDRETCSLRNSRSRSAEIMGVNAASFLSVTIRRTAWLSE